MRRFVMALDCDGLICNFVDGLLGLVEEVTGRRYASSDLTEFDFARALGLSLREERAVKRIIGSRRGFALGLSPYPLARQGVRRLRGLGDVLCVTTPWDSSPWWREEREAWLALHFGIDHVVHAVDKTSCEADLFVDDRGSHVAAWARAWPGRAAVHWRTPHNRSEAVPAEARATDSWDELYQIAYTEALRGVRATMEVAS